MAPGQRGAPKPVSRRAVEAATAAASRWKFEPAVDSQGRKVSEWAVIEVIVVPRKQQ
jgi:hypothetical protein